MAARSASLSGTGSDGTLGIKSIKEKGGLALVQAPEEAEFDGMPRSALSTGLVDLVVPIAEMAGAIARFARTEPRVQVPEDQEHVEERDERFIHKMFAHLRTVSGRDFSRYKRSTILRRITRRMQLNQIEELEDYLLRLRNNRKRCVFWRTTS